MSNRNCRNSPAEQIPRKKKRFGDIGILIVALMIFSIGIIAPSAVLSLSRILGYVPPIVALFLIVLSLRRPPGRHLAGTQVFGMATVCGYWVALGISVIWKGRYET